MIARNATDTECAKRNWRVVFMALTMATSSLMHASDSDGSSNLDGAFLTLSVDVIDGHLAFRSFSVTPSTRNAFVDACTHGKRIWLNGQSAPCVSANVVADSVVVQLEASKDADKALHIAGYCVVSARASSYAALRDTNDEERSALQGYAASAASKPTISATSLDHAKAVEGRGRSLVFVPYGKDRDGNRLTHVFSVSHGQVVYAGKLPDWPEKLIHIGHDDAPQVIVNREGDARVIQAFTIWPRVKPTMFAGEGG